MKIKGSQLKKGDYISLGKAVASFNRKINELKTEENKTYLPEIIEYKDISERIVTKKELDRYIKNLRSFKKSDIEDIYETKAGEKITFWERDILEEERKIAIERMEKDLKYNVNKYDRDTIDFLVSNISKMKKLEDTTNEKGDFKDLVKKIHTLGKTDYNYRKYLIYRENLLKALEETKNYRYHDKLIKKLNSIRNPIKFYEFTRQSEYLKDFFVNYESGVGVTITAGNFSKDEDAFNYMLEQLGIDMNYKYSLIGQDGSILGESDNKQKLIEIIRRNKNNDRFKNAQITVNE